VGLRSVVGRARSLGGRRREALGQRGHGLTATKIATGSATKGTKSTKVEMLQFARPADRDAWILARRGAKAALDPAVAYASQWEEERDEAGRLQPTAVIFLTNRECPFRCVMCDLWAQTLDTTVARGAIPGQICGALAALPPVRQVKLYNAGSFFDPRAVPPGDHLDIARAVDGLDRVIVEAHPSFLQGAAAERCLRFRDRIEGRLEVAIGLETAHPEALARLNKRMTLASFQRAAAFLAAHDIALRVFVLLGTPFLSTEEDVEWTCRSIDMARRCGATACSIIPIRRGNGALEALGEPASPPTLTGLERALEHGLSGGPSCRIFADLWDVERLFTCACSPRRATRLRDMNRTQGPVEPVICGCVHGGGGGHGGRGGHR
jgi:archaeosine synthase beta-subunit